MKVVITMQYTTLGTTSIEISKLCLGCMSFGDRSSQMHAWTLNQAQTSEIVHHALDLGINFFDTANQYSAGTSEEYLGNALRGVPRDKVIIASKVYFNEGKLSRNAIEREIEGSLRRLGTDYLDLYIIHRFDYSTPMEETMSALHDLVKAGKVRALGASAMYGYQFANMQRIARDNSLTPFSSMQNHYNLLYREDERELIPICKEQHVSLTPYSVLAAGRLSRANWSSDTLRFQTDAIAQRKYDATRQGDEAIVEVVAALAEKYQVTMTQIALSWQYAKGVASPIVGITKKHYLNDAIQALDVPLTQDDIDALEAHYLPHEISGAIPMPNK